MRQSKLFKVAINTRIAITVTAFAVALSGCTYNRTGPVISHFQDFNTSMPLGRSVTVCRAYGCKIQTKVRMSKKDVAAIKALMSKTKKADTPAEERRAVAYAVGWIERRIGKQIGTDKDRPGMELSGSGDPTQQDCVDEATNSTSYLLFLKSEGLLKYHKVGTPFSKGNVLMGVKYWPHWTAVLTENSNGQRWAVDSWIYANGENPAVVQAEKWYISDLDNLPKPTT